MSHDQNNGNGVLVTPGQMLSSLARELKHPLTYISRRAELSVDSGDDAALSAIMQSAANALALIDSYLLSARSEYGQQQLPLEPIGIGSVLFDVAQILNQSARSRNCTLEVITGHAGPVMAHAEGLRSALTCLTSQLLLCDSDESKPRIIRLNAYKQNSNSPVAAVLDPYIKLSQKNLSVARRMQGRSHMALSSRSMGSGVHLAIAESLAQSIGARLDVVHRQGMSGFGLRLIRSEQLQLV